MPSYTIQLADGADALGLPDMLKDLIGQNLAAHPAKVADFNKGRLIIHAGLLPPTHIIVSTDSEIIMALSNQTIKWGLPYYFDETGQEILAAMKSGRLKAQGMLLHLPSMIRFSRLMSVH